MTIAIVRLDHIQINVTDLARAKRFYGEVLGLEEAPRPESFDFAGAWYRIGEVDLHLVVRPPEPDSEDHFCLWVADVHGTAAALEARGETRRLAGPVQDRRRRPLLHPRPRRQPHRGAGAGRHRPVALE